MKKVDFYVVLTDGDTDEFTITEEDDVVITDGGHLYVRFADKSILYYPAHALFFVSSQVRSEGE